MVSCFSLLHHSLSYFSMPCLLLWRLSFLIGVSLCQLSSSACFFFSPSSHRPHLFLSSPTSPILYLREETGIRQTASLPLCIGLNSVRVSRLFIPSSCSCCHAASLWINQAGSGCETVLLHTRSRYCLTMHFLYNSSTDTADLDLHCFLPCHLFVVVLQCRITEVKIESEEKSCSIVVDY